MRTLCLILVVFVGFSFSNNLKAQENQQDKSGIEINSEDSVEYDLLVFDPGFDTFLATLTYSKDHYSNEYYKAWNIRYCVEWNIRHQNVAKYGDFYESPIYYDQSVDYGIDLNFKLYQYFQFIEKRYDIVLISRKGK